MSEKKQQSTKAKQSRAKRPEPREVDVIAAVEEAYGEIEALKEEMENWQSNLESAGMENVPKYEEVEECVNALEQIEEPDADLAGSLRSHKMRIQDPTPRKRGFSRPERMSQALGILSEAKAELEQISDWLDGYIDAIENAISEGEGINFPGMF